MTVRKRGDHWHVDFQIRGMRYREAIPEAQTKRDALDVEADMRRAVYEGRYGRQSKQISFERFVAEVFTPYAELNRKRHEQDARVLKRFAEIFKGRNLTDIAPMLIEQAKKKLSTELKPDGEPRQASTVNQMFAVLRRVFSLAVENNYLVSSPMIHVRKLKEKAKTERVMDEMEESRIRDVMLDAAYFVLSVFFELVLQTGMRESEVCLLAHEDVDFQKRLIILPAHKTKEAKIKRIPLNQKAYELLLERKGETRNYFVGVTAGHIRNLWREVCKKANVEGLTIHMLRHTVSTRLAEAGVSDSVRAALLGHSSVRMTEHYTHIGIESLADAVENLTQKRHKEKVRVGNFKQI